MYLSRNIKWKFLKLLLFSSITHCSCLKPLSLHIAVSFLNGFSVPLLLSCTVRRHSQPSSPKPPHLTPNSFWLCRISPEKYSLNVSWWMFSHPEDSNFAKENCGANLTSKDTLSLEAGGDSGRPCNYVFIILSLSWIIKQLTFIRVSCGPGTVLSPLHILSLNPHNHLMN